MRWIVLFGLIGCAYTPKDFARQYPQVACDRMYRCGTWSVLDLELSDCIAERSTDYGQVFFRSNDFDPENARACLADIANLECSEGTLPLDFGSCREVYGPPTDGFVDTGRFFVGRQTP
ncbi:MAG: hypothetical protein R3F61_27785 [Myxococcota bacterium]